MQLMFIHVDITNENLAMPFLTLFGIEDVNKTVVSLWYFFQSVSLTLCDLLKIKLQANVINL